MAFVNELIPEEQKERFAFPVYISPFDGSKPTLWKWTIDRERDVYLVQVGGGGGGYGGTPITKHFIMSWHGDLISISADPLNVTETQEGVVMHWRLHRLVIPSTLQDRREVVIGLIKEAFTTMGVVYDGEQYVTVSVDFKVTRTS